MEYPVELGATPAEEECQQVGTPNYDAGLAHIECQVYIGLLKRTLERENIPGRNGVRFKIQSNPHDFGCYYDVAAGAPDSDPEAQDAAWWLEDHAPTHWDADAVKELADRTAQLLAVRRKQAHR